MKGVKSNLRWPGGKSKMMNILDKYLPNSIDKYLDVFTGGGSVLLYIKQKYELEKIYSNDIDSNLINYYKSVQDDPDEVIRFCLDVKSRYNSETFREEFYKLDRSNSGEFFISNKTSFSGLNNNYSSQAYDRNFSIRSINKIREISGVIQGVNFINRDFRDIDKEIEDLNGYFIYLDPPYYGNKEVGLYGEGGKLHKGFDHIELFKWVRGHSISNKIMLSYDDNEFIREIYKDYNIYNFDFIYSMTNTGGNLCRKGNEIVITNYKVE